MAECNEEQAGQISHLDVNTGSVLQGNWTGATGAGRWGQAVMLDRVGRVGVAEKMASGSSKRKGGIRPVTWMKNTLVNINSESKRPKETVSSAHSGWKRGWCGRRWVSEWGGCKRRWAREAVGLQTTGGWGARKDVSSAGRGMGITTARRAGWHDHRCLPVIKAASAETQSEGRN